MRVLIVDDEYLIRDGLARSLDWASLGFDVVETAEHGLEALEMVKNHRPDLILTDIRMPFMDGLTLIREIKSIYDQACVVIISGHEEFDYAKTALKLDVFDYVLKPINLNELEQVVRQAISHIEELGLRFKEMTDIREQMQNSMSVLKEHFMLDLVFGKLSEDQILSSAKDYGLNPAHFFAAALIEVGSPSCEQSDSFYENQRQLEIYFEEMVSNRDFLFIASISTHEYLLVANDAAEDRLEENLNGIKAEIELQAKEFGLSTTLSAGASSYGLIGLQGSYQYALYAASELFMGAGNRALSFAQDTSKNLPDSIEFFDISAFKNALTFSDKSAIMSAFNDLRTLVITQSNAPKLVIQLLCLNLFLECKRVLREQGAEIDAVLENPASSIQSIINQPSYERMFEALASLISSILDYYDVVRFKQYAFDVDKAKKFIQANYRDVTLSLKSIAKHINMSACYFSVIFKKETGITYINYLTGIRVDKAKALLLNSNMKVYEIAYEVGYDNPTYFSTLFKKITGISPFDYKKKILSSSSD